MKISIAMATYNGAKYLQEQLDSFVAQTRQPDELVVCDDDSTDTTVEILESFRQQAPFAVRIYRNEKNLGYVKNFEKALGLCTGDIIFLSDQDDVWFENKLAVVLQYFHDNPDTMVFINDYYVSDEECKNPLFSKLSNIELMGFGEDWYVAGCSTAIRSRFLDIILPIPQHIHGHDSWINKLAIFTRKRMIIHHALQLYRRHPENTSNSIVNKKYLLPIFAIVGRYGLKDCREGWRKEIINNNGYIQRLLVARSMDIYQVSINLIDESIARLIKKNAAIEIRVDLLEFYGFRRFYKIFNLWKNGFYNQFEGHKSAVKDILRP